VCVYVMCVYVSIRRKRHGKHTCKSKQKRRAKHRQNVQKRSDRKVFDPNFTVVIGVEMHAQIMAKSKLFSGTHTHHTHIHTHTYIHTYIHIHIHTHEHTYAHTHDLLVITTWLLPILCLYVHTYMNAIYVNSSFH